jgi:hypothetical protein
LLPFVVAAGALVLAVAAVGGAYAYGRESTQPAASVSPAIQTPAPVGSVSPVSRESACFFLLPLPQRGVEVADAMLDDVPPSQPVIDEILADFAVHEHWWPTDMRTDVATVVLTLRHMRAGRLDTTPLGKAGLALTEQCRPYVKP